MIEDYTRAKEDAKKYIEKLREFLTVEDLQKIEAAKKTLKRGRQISDKVLNRRVTI